MPDVAVVGLGMITAVGLTTPETAASVRSATARFAETPMLDKRFEPFTLAEVLDEGLPPLAEALASVPLTSRESRMLRLGGAALRECIASLPTGAEAPRLVLALPETETTKPLDGRAFLQHLAIQAGGVFAVPGSDVSLRGRAGGLLAVGYAVELVRSGLATCAVAGGIDTYRDLHVLGALDAEGRVKSAANLDGFIPGEGAGFVAVAATSAAGLAKLSAVAEAEETGHLYSTEPYRGEGLAVAVQRLLETGAATEPIREVFSSMNGESHWAKEWGVAFLRSRGAFQPEHGMHHPADCYGDTGAACGALLVGLAATGLREGYRDGPCLVYASSDRGRRAATIVSTV
jgi:3-oxoacyl-[acyl-carrier-protein] synthase I